MYSVTDTVKKLKALIDSNGPGYLSEDPYQVYKELIASGASDKKTAGALMFLYTTGILEKVVPENDPSFVSGLIRKECCFNKKMADHLVEILLLLHSRRHEEEWQSRDMRGLAQFKRARMTCKWEGAACWEYGNGSVDCHYVAEIVIKPTKDLVIDDELARRLKKNPFLTAEVIQAFYEESLRKYLDREFEEYCTEDAYYEPVVEDFELDHYVNEWCEKNGYRLLSCEGRGHDGGYRPAFRHRRK